MLSFLVSAGVGQTATVTGVTSAGGTVKVDYTDGPAPSPGAHVAIAYTSTVFIAIPKEKLPALPFTVSDFGGPVQVTAIAH